jgi:hypothetical protein
MGEKITVLMHGAALDRGAGPQCGKCFLGRGDLVADSFAGDFPLELD